MGRAIALKLAAQDWRVVIVGRRKAALEETVRSAGAHGSRITCHACDVGDPVAVAAMGKLVADELKEVEVLINSAGTNVPRRSLEALSLDDYHALIAANLNGAYYCVQAFLPQMRARGRGLIVNISFWAAQKHIGNTIYGVSKAATDKLTADMAHELRPHGIAVVSLYPGLVRTEAVMEAAKGGWLDLSNSESPQFIGRVLAALARDPSLMERTGSVLVAASLAAEFGVTDVDGRQPRPLTLESV